MRILRLPLALATIATTLVSPAASQPANAQISPAPSLSRQTTLVVVPALVRDKAGKLVFTLQADDFVLTDDGVPQKLTVEPDTGGEPLALVVVIETGGAGARELEKLGPLPQLLDTVVGSVSHKIAVVAFDSEPELVQPFTPRTDTAAQAIADLNPGCSSRLQGINCRASVQKPTDADNGAAILDSLGFAVDLLRDQPAGYRRAILLVSETLDRGSNMKLDEAVRAISDTNTAIYSIGFSTGKSEAVHYGYRELRREVTRSYPNPPHGCMGKEPVPDPDVTQNKVVQAYDCLMQLAPPLGLAKMAAIAITRWTASQCPRDRGAPHRRRIFQAHRRKEPGAQPADHQ